MIKIIAIALFYTMVFTRFAAAKETFVCNFEKDTHPQTMVAPCQETSVANAGIINAALRIGKNAEGNNARMVYRIKDIQQAPKLFGTNSPFPMRQGRLSFSFRPVTWKLGESGFNMML